MSVPHFVPIHQVDVEIFHWIHENFGLLVALEENVGDPYLYIMAIHPVAEIIKWWTATTANNIQLAGGLASLKSRQPCSVPSSRPKQTQQGSAGSDTRAHTHTPLLCTELGCLCELCPENQVRHCYFLPAFFNKCGEDRIGSGNNRFPVRIY